jgi:hypothetical protein
MWEGAERRSQERLLMDRLREDAAGGASCSPGTYLQPAGPGAHGGRLIASTSLIQPGSRASLLHCQGFRGCRLAAWRTDVMEELGVPLPAARERRTRRRPRTATGGTPAKVRTRDHVARLLQELECETAEVQCALAATPSPDDRLQLSACQALLDQAACCVTMATREHRTAERRLLLKKGSELLAESLERRREYLLQGC